MELVSGAIVEYLRENRRLVVPNFGAFMVKETGEKVFSDLLRTDDGVLMSLLRARGLSDLESAAVINRFVYSVRREIEQNGCCRLENLGTLRMDADNRTIRLYEPVRSDLNIAVPSTPYIPEPLSAAESVAIEAEAAEAEAKQAKPSVTSAGQGLLSLYDEPQTPTVESPVVEQPKAEQPKTEQPKTEQPASTPKSEQPVAKQPEPKAKPRKKFDVVMLLAVIIVVMALAAIAYGVYVGSQSGYLGAEVDDAIMDSRRITE